ncbi:MAG: GLPGLI family protein [Saprospiraceae bacterium]|nr:GLPGLI family protein [Saprospiraceae bacterium]
MKKLIFLFVLSSFSTIFYAQTASTTEGVITFEEKINMHRRLQNEQMKAMIPEFRISNMMFYFRGEECMYKPDENEEDEETNSNGGGRFRRPQGETYRNITVNKQVSTSEWAGKKYLIEDTLRQTAWKIGSDTKKVAGYECTKATFRDTARKVELIVWFTMDLPLSAGPQMYGSLPGLILEVDLNNGELVTTAKKIEFKKIKDKDIVVPTKGEKITQAELRKKREEWIKANGGRGGRS